MHNEIRIVSVRQVFLVRLLRDAAPDAGNTKMPLIFNHNRYKYSLQADTDVVLHLVPISDVLHPVGLVLDAQEYYSRHDLSTRLGSAADNAEERRHVHFYEVHGWALTALTEKCAQVNA